MKCGFQRESNLPSFLQAHHVVIQKLNGPRISSLPTQSFLTVHAYDHSVQNFSGYMPTILQRVPYKTGVKGQHRYTGRTQKGQSILINLVSSMLYSKCMVPSLNFCIPYKFSSLLTSGKAMTWIGKLLSIRVSKTISRLLNDELNKREQCWADHYY